jgi:hypothetical protein
MPLPPKVKGPIRRKPRQSLEAMSAALDKGRKMTTLEKVSAPRLSCTYRGTQQALHVFVLR